MDLRTLKTERAIKNAFIELRSKKNLEKITVKELCELACVNKSTFYAHYEDIYALSDTMEEEVVTSITGSISHPEYIMENPAKFTEELFLAYLSQNSLIRILFSGKQQSHLADKIEKSVKEIIFEKYPACRENMTINIVLSYCIQGGYHAYMGNPGCEEGKLISVIGELTERARSLYKIDS